MWIWKSQKETLVWNPLSDSSSADTNVGSHDETKWCVKSESLFTGDPTTADWWYRPRLNVSSICGYENMQSDADV